MQRRIIGLLPIYNNHINTGDTCLRRVEECVVDELAFEGNLEAALLLLQLGDDVLHVLLDLRLSFNFEAIRRIRRQLGMVLVLLLTYEHLQMVQLRRLQITLHRRQFIRHLRLVSSNLHQSTQVNLTPGTSLNNNLAELAYLYRRCTLGILILRTALVRLRHVDLLIGIVLLELLVAHLDEHVVVDLV